MILIIPTILLIIGITLLQTYNWHWLGLTLNAIGGISLFILLIWFAAARFTTATYLERRGALQETYEQSRKMSEFERATITKDIAKFNESLAVDKYWNETWMFDWFVDDVVIEIEPIK